jgi:hypothetical protein
VRALTQALLIGTPTLLEWVPVWCLMAIPRLAKSGNIVAGLIAGVGIAGVGQAGMPWPVRAECSVGDYGKAPSPRPNKGPRRKDGGDADG